MHLTCTPSRQTFPCDRRSKSLGLNDGHGSFGIVIPQPVKLILQNGTPPVPFMSIIPPVNCYSLRLSQIKHLYWNEQACDNGHGTACVKVARAYLKTLPSSLPFDPRKAMTLFERAVELSEEPDGHYGLAGMYLQSANKSSQEQTQEEEEEEGGGPSSVVVPSDARIVHSILHLHLLH